MTPIQFANLPPTPTFGAYTGDAAPEWHRKKIEKAVGNAAVASDGLLAVPNGGDK